VRVYWEADRSVLILNLSGVDEDPDRLYHKYRIDLAKDVVPTGKYGNLGCCSVEKAWVDKVLADCRAGQKLTIKRVKKWAGVANLDEP
jgi:hypothetical protein